MASLSASNHVARVLSVADQVTGIDNGSRIANSWRRCLIDHKLDPARRGPPQTFTEAEVRHVTEPMEELIQAGQVNVNGRLAKLGARVSANDRITVGDPAVRHGRGWFVEIA